MPRERYSNGAPTLLPWCSSDGVEQRVLNTLLGERYALPLQQVARYFFPGNVRQRTAIATYGQIARDTGLPVGRIRHALRELTGRQAKVLPWMPVYQFLHVEFWKPEGATLPHWFLEYDRLQGYYAYARSNGRGEMLAFWERQMRYTSVHPPSGLTVPRQD